MFFRRWQRTSSGVPRLCFAQDFEAAIPRPHTRQDTVRASGPDAIQCSRAEPPGSRRPRSGLRFCSAKGFGVIIPQPPQFCPMQNRVRYNVLERSRQAPEGRKAGFAFASAKGFEVIILHPLYPSGYSRRPTATAVRASGPDAEQCSRREAEGFKRRTAPFLLLCKRLRGYYTTCQRKKQISAGRIHTFFTVYSRRYEPAGAGAYFSRKQLFPKGESP